MTSLPRTLALLAFLAPLAGPPVPVAHGADPGQIEFFEKRIRPLLVAHCYECHSVQSKSLKANLRLDSRGAILKGGDSGPAISTASPDASLLLEAVRYEAYEMPPRGKLPAADIAAFEKWVRMGAPWPDEPEPTAVASPPQFDLAARKASHWCWQPVRAPKVPSVHDVAWPRDDLDRFVLAKLEQRGFKPAPSVDRRTLIRRLSFDLIGLPPTPGEIETFVSDAAPNAVEKVVDQLLDSPHFGERWGRHWLDLVRYAESRGHEFDNDTPNAWQYRDYVIRALNADVPYDQFVREHIAGDLLDPPRLHPEKKFNESILGTGFWHLGEWVHSPVDIRKDETDRFDNMLDVMSKTFLGVTVACARCHDHKFDAISQKDYYALSGFLQGSDYRQVAFEALEHNKWLAGEVANIDAEANQRLRELLARTALKRAPEVTDLAFSGLLPDDDPGQLPEGCRILFDFRDQSERKLAQDGAIFRLVRPGEFVPKSEEHRELWSTLVRTSYVLTDDVWNESSFPTRPSPNQKGALESLSRSGRTIRTPTFPIGTGEVRCRVRGDVHVFACVDSHRLIAGPLHGETIAGNVGGDRSEWKWVRLNLSRYRGHLAHFEFSASPGQSLAIQLGIEGPEPSQPSRIDVDMPVDADQLRPFVIDAIEAWRANTPGRETELKVRGRVVFGALYLLSRSPEFVREWTVEMDAWKARRTEARAGVSKAAGLAPAMLDGSGEDDRLLIRGNSSTPGEVVPRRFLEAIDGQAAMAIPTGSGRRELAERIAAKSNPLTSRVIVNRLWHHLLGRGIVPTVDDFGVLGQPPTHPELLDYLATEFQKDGQSLKRMIRRIVLSQTYRMSGDSDPKIVEADPKNELWHHRPPKRLEGEAIRDSLLAVSGRLDRTQFGPSVKVHLTPFMEGRGRPPESGPLDGAGRRSIYLEVRRNFLSPFMLTFDTPNPFSTMGRRNVSNVPAQALIMLNDPFVRECADGLAQRVTTEGPAAADGRIGWLYQTALGRSPSSEEIRLVRSFLAADESGEELRQGENAWGDVAHALLNSKEFLFVK